MPGVPSAHTGDGHPSCPLQAQRRRPLAWPAGRRQRQPQHGVAHAAQAEQPYVMHATLHVVDGGALAAHAQTMGILPWTYAQLRHAHPRMFEALAEQGMRLLRLPEDAGGINDRSLAMCIWVRAPPCWLLRPGALLALWVPAMSVSCKPCFVPLAAKGPIGPLYAAQELVESNAGVAGLKAAATAC